VDEWFVYVLSCGDGSLYTGVARDVDARLEQHRAGKGAKYTRGRGPLEVIYRETAPDRGSALRRELAIKAMSRAEKDELTKPRKRKRKR
jgi:predicted GIY-YIG superfamily endonuclease